MEISEIKDKILTTIEQLSAEKLQMALELLEDLRQSEEDASQALPLDALTLPLLDFHRTLSNTTTSSGSAVSSKEVFA
jgi:hypothetical protein